MSSVLSLWLPDLHLAAVQQQTQFLRSKSDSVCDGVLPAAFVGSYGGVKAILEHKSTSRLYECLPNYLSRTGVDVIWRTNNTGEPPTLNVKKFLKADSLSKMCVGENCGYDEVLLAGLKKQILESKKNKI